MTYKNKKTKICFIICRAYPLFNPEIKSPFGGAEVNLYNIAIQLSKESRYDVYFLVGDYGQKNIEIYENVKVLKLNYFNLAKYKKTYHKVLRYLSLFSRIISVNADIYITSTACEILGWTVLLAGMLKKKKVIHRIASDSDLDMAYCRKKGIKFYLLYNLGLRKCNSIAAQTNAQKLLLMNRFRLDSNVIGNGVFITDIINFGNKKYILWVSRALKIKRPELIIEMARRLPEEKFVIIIPPSGTSGESYPNEETKFREYIINKAALIKNIKVIGYVPFNKISWFFEKSKLFVNTSLFEGFPNSFIQAFLAGTPVLSFRIDPDSVIKRYDMGCVCNDNLDNGVNFIRGLKDEKILYYGNNACKYVRENHNIRDIAKKYEALFNIDFS